MFLYITPKLWNKLKWTKQKSTRFLKFLSFCIRIHKKTTLQYISLSWSPWFLPKRTVLVGGDERMKNLYPHPIYPQGYKLIVGASFEKRQYTQRCHSLSASCCVLLNNAIWLAFRNNLQPQAKTPKLQVQLMLLKYNWSTWCQESPGAH